MSRFSSFLLPGPMFRRQPRISDGLYRSPAPASCSTEQSILAASLFFTLFSNHRFWSAWLAEQSLLAPAGWLHVVAMFVLLTAVHCILFGLVVTERTARPVLGTAFVLTALATHYMNRYTVFFDADMMRNVFHTDIKEARELVSLSMIADVALYGVLPAVALWRVPLTRRTLRRAAAMRLAFLLGALIAAVAALGCDFQDMSAQMRNRKELRYLITPGNYIVSGLRMAAADGAQARLPRLPVGADAHRLVTGGRDKPLLLVVVVGETARAANWGLNGYVRNTTPELAASGVINFPHVSACGSNTEVSLPCMFSRFGRRHYDKEAIGRHESVLHVLEHGGVRTLWRDNQSGCKGVCEGLALQQLDTRADKALCDGERCLDEILLSDLDATLRANHGDMVIVLHQLGNHGPAYSQRYPAAYRRFAPTCDTSDLGKCTREQIVNSYDNALLYTDHFLAEALRRLKAQQSHDAAMLYVSDHGESLGEKGIYLHGLPYAIAPREQTTVPMVMWLSPAFAARNGVDVDCLARQAPRPLSHDYLFHSLLGLMQVKTSVYEPALDLAADCRHDAAGPSAMTALDGQVVARAHVAAGTAHH